MCNAVRSDTCSSFPVIPLRPGSRPSHRFPIRSGTPPEQSAQLPKIPTTPISYADAWPILDHLGGPDSPRDWQGALPFTYHVGPGPVKVKIHLKQDYQYRTIWDVIGSAPGSELPGRMGGGRKSSRRLGLRSSRPKQRHRGDAGVGAGFGELLKSDGSRSAPWCSPAGMRKKKV